MFCFVVLHYKTHEDTIECVDSMLALHADCQIVIVDNYSNNGSIEIIEKLYDKKENIHIIKNKQNLGFASGNNIGYRYAKEVLHAGFIAISNNDIIINSPDFIERIQDFYTIKHFYLLGPDIESLVDHKHQNPMSGLLMTKLMINKAIARYSILFLLSKIGLYDFLRKRGERRDNSQECVYRNDVQEDVQLHGSFIVFSPEFINKEDNAFIEGTFLYMEEAILYHYCKLNGYKCVYYPDVKVYHKEDSSTKALFELEKEKREFVFSNMIKSLIVYKRILEL